MDKPSAKVICHSKAPNGEELITMEVEFHRFILAEINTHRTLSRNYQSSRAIPIKKMIDQVRNDPAIPVYWGKNQRGMVAQEELKSEELYLSQSYWKLAANQAAHVAELMDEQKCHKQVVNRILEPFMWTKGVITGTRKAWEGMFKLRCHPDAQPEYKVLAEKIREAIDNSTPNELDYGDYHLPYVDNDKFYTVNEAVKISCSCCAQVSYRTLDDSLEKALKIYDMLNLPEKGIEKEDPPHFSPAEHVARVWDHGMKYLSGNFNSMVFYQYRKALEIGEEHNFIYE